jgi:tetratricopeptide (TPR) repeat protein
VTLSLSLIGVVLAVCALRQERIPYPHNLKEPDSVAEAKELLLSHPARASSHLSLLRLLQDKTPLSWQLSESQAALWLEPSNPYVRDLYASTLLRMGKTAEGLREITRSIVNSPSLSTHFYLTARLLPWLSAAEQKAVEEGFKQALALGPPESLGSLSEFYARLGRFSDRGLLYEQAALRERDGPKKADFLLHSGLAYAIARDEAKAEHLFRKAIAAIPTDPRGYHHLATAIYGPSKKLGMAKEVVAEGVKKGAPAFDLYLSLAEAAEKAGSPGDSKAALHSAKLEVERSSRKGQDPFPLYFLLADVASKVHDRDEERDALLTALNLRPRSSNTLFRLANLYLQEQNFDRAVLYFSRIANINSNSADVYYNLAMAEERRYRFAAAEKAYARAVELAPYNKSFQSRYEELKRKVAQSRKDEVTR